MLVKLHRCHDRQAALDAAVVVEINVIRNHLHELRPVSEPVTVVAFPFENTPEAFHRAVIKAMRHTGHTLLHACCPQLLMKDGARILVAPVAMEQRVSIWLSGNGSVECVKDKFVVVAVANGKGDNSPVTEIQDGA